MLRAALKILALVSVSIVLFSGGALTAIRSHWASPIATVLVRNETTRVLRSVSVRYTTCGNTRTLLFATPDQPATAPIGREIRMDIVLCGEGSHATQVVFSDGYTLRSEGSYIEGGSVVTERITGSGILSEYKRLLP
jgi:hypothetical protein